MLWYVIIGFLAAFGALCALWVLLGAWLTDAAPCCVVLFPAPGREEAAVRRFLWLRELGLIKGRLILVCDTPPAHLPSVVECMTREQYGQTLEQERET